MGAFQGDFSSLAAHDLGAFAIRAAIERAGISPDVVNDVIFGNCLMAGQGQAPARQASIKAGIPVSAGAVTLSKMCGSAMQATIYGVDSLVAGTNDVAAPLFVGTLTTVLVFGPIVFVRGLAAGAVLNGLHQDRRGGEERQVALVLGRHRGRG